MRHVYLTILKLNRERNHFSNTLVLDDLKFAFLASNFKCLGGVVVSVLDSYFGERRVRASVEPIFLCTFYFFFLFIDSESIII